jgi:hypothetical protein
LAAHQPAQTKFPRIPVCIVIAVGVLVVVAVGMNVGVWVARLLVQMPSQKPGPVAV